MGYKNDFISVHGSTAWLCGRARSDAVVFIECFEVLVFRE
jgi:hypothetical protein